MVPGLPTLEICTHPVWATLYPNSTVIPQDGATPLIIASQNGHSTIVQLLIVAGASLDVQAEVICAILSTQFRMRLQSLAWHMHMVNSLVPEGFPHFCIAPQSLTL